MADDDIARHMGSLEVDGDLRLRPIAESDLVALHAILQEPGVSTWWGDYDLARVRRDLLDDRGSARFAIVDGAQLIGAIQFHEELAPDFRSAGIDLFLTCGRHGEGIGPRAITVLAEHLIQARGHHRITIDPAAANAAAIRAYAKVGFRPVGVMRQYQRGPDGVWQDGLLMDLLAPELVRPQPTLTR